MTYLKKIWLLARREPLRTISLIQVLLGAAAAFGLGLEPGQEKAGLLVLGVLLGANEVVRDNVTPVSKVQAAGMRWNRPMSRWEKR